MDSNNQFTPGSGDFGASPPANDTTLDLEAARALVAEQTVPTNFASQSTDLNQIQPAMPTAISPTPAESPQISATAYSNVQSPPVQEQTVFMPESPVITPNLIPDPYQNHITPANPAVENTSPPATDQAVPFINSAEAVSSAAFTTASPINPVLPPTAPVYQPMLASATPVVGFGEDPATLAAMPAVQVKQSFIKSKLFKLLAIVTAGVLLLGGSGAAAYFGVVVPNKPENVLKSAITNLLKSRRYSAKGSIEVKSGTELMVLDFNAQYDQDKQASATAFELTFNGIKIPFEIRIVDRNLYFKVGDLSTLESLANGFLDPAYSKYVDGTVKKLKDQWVEVDKTLLASAKLDCFIDNANAGFNDADIKLLTDAYKTNQFTSIKSSSSDKIDGHAATKFNISVDDAKLTNFGDKLTKLSVVQKISECTGTSLPASSSNGFDQEIKAQSSNSPQPDINIWVDKGTKKINQATVNYKDTDASLVFKINLNYDQVSISKPDNAKPLLQLVGEFGSFYQGLFDGFGSFYPGVQSKAKDTERQTDIKAMHGQIEAYYAQFGKYPSLAQMNDSTWRAQNMKGMDAEALKDPDGSGYTLVAAPAKNVYAYTVTNAAGGSCDNKSKDCVAYTLTATLDGGGTYVKTNLN